MLFEQYNCIFNNKKHRNYDLHMHISLVQLLSVNFHMNSFMQLTEIDRLIDEGQENLRGYLHRFLITSRI